jgi:hypothetical protein
MRKIPTLYVRDPATHYVTDQTVGWQPIEQSPFRTAHAEALDKYEHDMGESISDPGTYELCGPKVNGNPERLGRHWLIPHGEAVGVARATNPSPRGLIAHCRDEGQR